MLDSHQIRLFWARINVTGPEECHLWTGGRDRDGYGLVKYGDFRTSAHRLVWMLEYGEIEEGIKILHTCDNPPCCNIRHLFEGFHQDNMDDMKRKGRQRSLRGDDHPNTLLSDQDVEEIRAIHVPNSTGKYGTTEIAKRFGVSPVTIRQIIQRNRRKS